MLPHSSPSRPAGRARRVATTLIALACGAVVGGFAGCSTSDCKSMKGSGSFFGDVVCGGQGSDAPEPDALKANACTDIRLVMPGFFKLLDDPTRPLASLREAVKTLGTPVCLNPRRACTPSDQCAIGDCGADNFCPCTESYSPLADLLQITFKGLAVVAKQNKDHPEPGAIAPSTCVSATAAASLPADKISKLCEVRRMLDALLQQNGGQRLLDDPNVLRVTVSLLQYIEGKKDGKPHYDLFTTLGRMAQNPGICPPTEAYGLLDKALAFYTPAKAAADIGAIQDLLADPLTKQFLTGLSTGNTAQGRQSTIVLAHDLLGAITSAQSGAAATQQIDNLLKKIVYPYLEQRFPQAYVTKVKTAVNAIIGDAGPLSAQAGIFPFAQRLLLCANNPVIDKDGEIIGALYDLISLQDTNGGIDLATLVGAIKTLTTLDSTGQVGRSLRVIIQSARDDDDATEAIRKLLAQVLTPEIGSKLLPPIDVLVQSKVLGEVVNLLDDLLYSCRPPPGQK